MKNESILHGCDHVAYATRNTDATISLLRTLGFSPVIYKRPLERFGVLVSKLGSLRGDLVEVVEPISDRSSVSRLLRTQSATLYHAAFRTPYFNTTRSDLLGIGALSISRPAVIPYPAFEIHRNFRASHMFHEYLGLFEITGVE